MRRRLGDDLEKIWRCKTEQPGIGKARRGQVTKRMYKRICRAIVNSLAG